MKRITVEEFRTHLLNYVSRAEQEPCEIMDGGTAVAWLVGPDWPAPAHPIPAKSVRRKPRKGPAAG